MISPDIHDLDPRFLRLPPTSLGGANPAKLQRQIARYGRSTDGMPPLVAYRGTDGELIVYDGFTRATRVAKLLPGQTVAGRDHRGFEVARGHVSDRRGASAMIDPVRREVLEILADLSEVVPEVRLGQLMANLSYLARGPANESIWDIEDEELLAVAREHLEQWRARRGAHA